MRNKKIHIKDICIIGIFAAIIIIVGQISIQMPVGVPMTLQTFVIPFVGIVLGAKKGMMATVIYVLLGALGLPVFSGFTGGMGIVFGVTGGFILSFPIMAYLAGMGAAIGAKKGRSAIHNIALTAIGTVSGTIINYLCGVVMFSIIMPSDIQTAFAACVIPFIFVDAVKVVLAVALGVYVKKILVKGKVLV